jgi:hypothetical protein
MFETLSKIGISNILIKGIETVCKEVYLNYNDKTYRMTNGIPMGINCAVELANLYLYHKVDKLVFNHPKLRTFKRYIDDIFGIWKGTEEELLTFKKYVDSLTPDILRTTEEHSLHSLHVLDIEIYKKDNKLEFKTFQKSLNSYQYLMPSSLHPKHTLKGYILGEILRYRRTNSEDTNFRMMKHLFYKRLLDRGFSENFLNPIFIGHFIEKPTEPPKDTIVLCLPHSTRPITSEIKRATKELLKYLKTDNLKILLTNTQPPNIGRIATRSSLTDIQKKIIKEENSEERTIENLMYLFEN